MTRTMKWFWPVFAMAAASCGNFPNEYRLGQAPRADPRLVLQGTNPYRDGGITVELDEPGHLGVFLLSNTGFLRLYYPYRRNQETRFDAGRHRIRGERPQLEGPLVIIVSSEQLHFDRLDRFVADDIYSRAGYNPANSYRATYDLGRGTIDETLHALPEVLVDDAAGPTWTLYYYRP